MNFVLDWFLKWQIRIAAIIGFICVFLIFIFDFRGFQALVFFIIALILIFFGSKLFPEDSSENWIKFAYFDSIKKMIGGILMLVGWLIILRQLLALAIASIFLKSI